MQPIPQPPPPPPPPGVLGNPLGLGELISPAGLEKLALSKEQKADFDKINDEFKKTQKELQTKLADFTKNPGQAPDPKVFTEIFEAQRNLRPTTLARVEKLLTDEQKKTLEQVRRELPGFGIGFGPGPIGFPPPMHFGPQIGGAFLPLDAQQRLKLTDEQKKKVNKFQKDLEGKILSVLTDDQKKMFDELKKNRVGPPFPGFFRRRRRRRLLRLRRASEFRRFRRCRRHRLTG